MVPYSKYGTYSKYLLSNISEQVKIVLSYMFPYMILCYLYDLRFKFLISSFLEENTFAHYNITRIIHILLEIL